MILSSTLIVGRTAQRKTVYLLDYQFITEEYSLLWVPPPPTTSVCSTTLLFEPCSSGIFYGGFIM